MSSRALKRAQQERERIALEQKRQEHGDEAGAEDDDDSEDEIPIQPTKPSLFAMLGTEDDEDDHDHDHDDGEGNQEDEQDASLEQDDVGHKDSNSAVPPKKKKKKTKKKKSKNAEGDGKEELDEIDAALKSLSTSNGVKSQQAQPKPQEETAVNEATAEVCRLLSIETSHLHVGNEMRRLFGRAAFDAEREAEQDRAEAQRRRRADGEETLGIAEIVQGRHSVSGAGLSEMLIKRNIFVAGKKEWPKGTTGGLSMEVIGKDPSGIVEYAFVHNKSYQSVQQQFVAHAMVLMEPQVILTGLRQNPYHVATLLQVAEMAKHEKDYSTAGDLQERALFSFGRSVHSTFAASLAQGKARLDFRRPENREFGLATMRYISNIGMRATWRTVYEWAKLLLSMDPNRDPYGIGLVIDQFALRARQPQHLLDLCQSTWFSRRWANYANIQYSQTLAMNHVVGINTAGKSTLVKAIATQPWIAASLLQELGAAKIPPAIWGKEAEAQVDQLHSTLYVTQGKDLWKTPDAMNFLEKAAASTTDEQVRPNHSTGDVELGEARYVIMTEDPALLRLLPKDMIERMGQGMDPLPPPDEVLSYTVMTTRQGSMTRQDPETYSLNAHHFVEELDVLQRFFEELIPGLGEPPAEDGMWGEITDERVEAAISASGMSIATLRSRMNRLLGLREALASAPERTVRDERSGAEAVMLGTGLVRTNLRDLQPALDQARRQDEEGAAVSALWRDELYEDMYSRLNGGGTDARE